MKARPVLCFVLGLVWATISMADPCNEDFFTNVNREQAAELATRTTAVSIFALFVRSEEFDRRMVSVRGEIAETENGLFYLVPAGSQRSKYLPLSRVLLEQEEDKLGCFLSNSVSDLIAIFGTFHVRNEEYSIRDIYYASKLLEDKPPSD